MKKMKWMEEYGYDGGGGGEGKKIKGERYQ